MVLLLQLLAMKKREKEEELRALRLSVAAEKKKSEDNLEWSKMQAEKDRMSHSIVGREWMMDNRRQKALQKQEEEYALRSAAATPPAPVESDRGSAVVSRLTRLRAHSRALARQELACAPHLAFSSCILHRPFPPHMRCH